ncbi:MAG: hypothetical protein FJ161_00720 [Gammaproteobacteria bacterium]|nr:hypothetical protein [Gammaproteobacteria bacterium]
MVDSVSASSELIFNGHWVAFSKSNTLPKEPWPVQWVETYDECARHPYHLLLDDDNLLLIVHGQCVYSAKECYQTVLQDQHGFIRTAVKRKNKYPTELIDGTAGWGREALTLALAGIKIFAIERAELPVIFLKYALEFIFPQTFIEVHHQPLDEYLQKQSHQIIEYIYCDPLFFESKRSLSKKSMQLLYHEDRRLFGGQQDDSLLKALKGHHIQSLLIKQPKNAPRLFNNNCVIIERYQKTCRYDLYCLNGAQLY